MADEDSAQERTEEPTAKRQQKAREEGQVPRSRDLTTTSILVLGTLGLFAFGNYIGEALVKVARFNFIVDRQTLADPASMFAHLETSLNSVLLVLMPLFAVLALAGVAGPVALGGWNFSANAMMPKLNRLDPISGLKRMFSIKSLVELAKGIAKVSLVILVAYALMAGMKFKLLALANMEVDEAMKAAVHLSLWAAMVLSASTLLIAAVDVPFQLWENKKKLRMSRQELKDEYKDTEGKPEVKSKIRQIQMRMAQSRMMANVPKADVVITNPTHFSVALKYDPERMQAPVLLAKGSDQLALKIREIARAHEIEFVESPALARAVFYTTEVEAEIPQGLYLAIAQVLAYVFQLREYRRGRGAKPPYPKNPDLPPNYRFDR